MDSRKKYQQPTPLDSQGLSAISKEGKKLSKVESVIPPYKQSGYIHKKNGYGMRMECIKKSSFEECGVKNW